MKRKFSVRLAAVVASALALSLSAVCVMSSAAYLGDVNNDNRVNSGDARIVLRHTAKLAPITDEKNLILADANGDGRVNSQDARTILRVAARLEQAVEYTEPENPPKPTDPKPTAPVPSTPKPSDPKPTEPVPTTPEPTDPEPTAPDPTVPDPTVPDPTEPEPTEPEPTEPEPTEPEPTAPIVESSECYNYYMKSVVKTYDAQGNETVNSVEFAVDRHEQKVGKKTVNYYDYFARVPGMVGNKDVGMLVKEKVNKTTGKVSQDYYLINYSDSEYLCLDSSVVDTVMSSGEPLIPDISPITIFKSLNGLDVTEVIEDGEVYYKFTEENPEAAGQTVEYYLVKAESGDYYYAAKTRMFTDGKLVSQTQILAMSLDPSAYVSVPDIKGITVNAANMLFKMQDMMDFMDKLGMTGM